MTPTAKDFTKDAARKIYTVISSVFSPPLLVFALITFFTFLVYTYAIQNLNDITRSNANKTADSNQVAFQNGMQNFTQILWGGAAKINANGVDKTSWDRFVATYNIPQQFPGISGVGVVEFIPDSNKAAYNEFQSLQHGRPVSIFPESSVPIHAALSYFYPETAKTSQGIGYDFSYSPTTAASTKDASGSGQPTIASVEALTPIDGSAATTPVPLEPGFVMYVPYYDRTMPLNTADERRQALRGFVFANFIPNALFANIFKQNGSENMRLSVTIDNGQNTKQLYRTGSLATNTPTISVLREVNVYDQTFYMRYDFQKQTMLSATQTKVPLIILISGITSALALSVITYFIMKLRYHRLSYEKERDVKLAKDDLLSLASHQLRTPATGVKQYIGMVLQGFAGPISKQQKQFLEKAYASNDRQLHIINDILYIAKLDAGRLVMAKTSFDLAAMVRDVVDEQRQQAKKAKLSLNVRTPKKVSSSGDSHMLRMVVENIVSNAIKYTPPDGSVYVRLKSTKHDHQIIVSDTGVGIDPKEFKNLFKQFQRIPNERSHLVSGTGVGLYLAQHFMTMHGGYISVDSEPGQGTIFTIVLPKEKSL